MITKQLENFIYILVNSDFFLLYIYYSNCILTNINKHLLIYQINYIFKKTDFFIKIIII